MAGPFSSSAAVCNAALEQIASQVTISALNDGTTAGNAAGIVYSPTVQLLLRSIEPDFARRSAALVVSGLPAPPPWAYEYTYPIDCVRLRQVVPPGSGTGSLADPNDPYPVKANVGFDSALAAPGKVIWSNQVNALAVYTSSSVTETAWDADFGDAVVRRLANPLAMALAGRPDFAKAILEEAGVMAQMSEAVEDSGFRKG